MDVRMRGMNKHTAATKIQARVRGRQARRAELKGKSGVALLAAAACGGEATAAAQPSV